MQTSETKHHVLVVDDDESIVRLIGATLARRLHATIDVTTTIEPAFAWGRAAEAKVDICITDMNMPHINGFKLLKHLKALNPLTQVIFLTAHPTLEAARSAFVMGADDFLPKPVNLDDLCNCVQFMSSRIARWHRELKTESVG